MANCLICYPNFADQCAVAGGAWSAGLPLANVLTGEIQRTARTLGTDPGATQMVVTLDRARPLFAVALVNHNLTSGGQYRITASIHADFSEPAWVVDWKDAWPALSTTDSLLWEDPEWWSGKPALEELAGYPANLLELVNGALVRYLRFEFRDTGNPAGFLEFGRLFLGRSWSPARNMSHGAALAWRPRSEIQESFSGTEYFTTKPSYREALFSLDWLNHREAMEKAFELQRLLGVTGELYFVFDPADRQNLPRQSFLGRLEELSPIEYPHPGINKTSFKIKELI